MTVELTPIFSSPVAINNKVDESLIAGLQSQFPIEGRNYILQASNFRAERKAFTHDDEKQAILESRSLTYPIKADLTLIDKNTGQVVDKQPNFSMMDSFHITGKHSMLYKGNNYTVANQLQLNAGAYTRFQDTGELQCHFNTASGSSFELNLDPENQLFYITPNKGTAKIPISTLLTNVFKISPQEVAQYIPAEAWAKNVAATAGKENRFLGDIYRRMVNTAKQIPNCPPAQMAEQLKDAFENSRLSPHVTKSTLGESFTGVTGKAILLAMRNMIETHKGLRQPDNRDSLQFKRVQNLPDYLTTRFDLQHQVVKVIKNKLIREVNNISPTEPKLRGKIGAKPFSKFFSSYLMSSKLISPPSETNPLESVENVAKVTVLGGGEGGIDNERSVPMGARDIDPSHLGIIDPSRTPESGHAGIDQRFTISSVRDKEGNLYAQVIDKNGARKTLSVHDMMTHVIGFPNQEDKDIVQAQIRGELGQCPRSEVEYWLADATDMYTITTNLVPFLNSDHPGRLTMAGKSMPQALSLVNREAPLVQTLNARNQSFVKQLANIVSTSSPVAGVVTKVDNTSVTLTTMDNPPRQVTVKAVKNLPFNMKGFHDDETACVKVGDHVNQGQQLFESNYTKDGVLALGKNLNVAYIPWKGYNHEDGLVLSKGCADSLSSHHAYKIDYEVTDLTVAKKAVFQSKFPAKITKEQAAKLDDYGYAKVGAILHHGDPCYAVLEKREISVEDRKLGLLHKTLVTPFTPRIGVWEHDEDGVVVDAFTTGKQVRFIVRSVKPLEVGDKLTGLHGNKGIVSLILDDHEMPHSAETGKPVDILLNPASVTSRVNLGQLMETGAAKIAAATGKPYMVHNFDKKNNVTEIRAELAKHGLSDTEELIDPVSKKSLGKILTGPQYFLKLYKTSDQNWSARNTGGYDNTLQPTKGGEEGSKGVGYMEVLGLMGSNARKNLKEIATTKSELNAEYWEKFLTGQALPKPKTTFATKKFLDYLTASGIKTTLKDGTLTASPLTDEHIIGLSNGQVKNSLMLSSKNLEPERGGLFDFNTTGGLTGTKWSHYRLAEPLPNPLFERPIKTILGLSTKEYDGITHGAIGVKKQGDTFHLHDVKTGAKIRSLKVNSFTGRPDIEEEPEIEDDSEPVDMFERQDD